MAKLSSERRFGGLILIGTTFLIGLVDIILGMIPITGLLGTFAIFNILFGILLFWAGRTIRNEKFLPKL